MPVIRLPVVAAVSILGVGLPIADSAAGDEGKTRSVPVVSLERVSANDSFGSATSLLGIALMGFIADWLTLEFDLPATEVVLPEVTLVPVSHLIAMRHGPKTPSPVTAHADVAAVYHDPTRTIFLPVGWTGRTPGELSLLVHEMVHHLQNIDGMTYACPEAREELAYSAQERWLMLSGTNLATEFGVDPMTLLVRTKCFY